MAYANIHFYHSNLCIRNFSDEIDCVQGYRLRHQVFAEDLKWVSPCPSGLEIDKYDNDCNNLGVFTDAGKLLGMARVLSPDCTWMLEEDLAALVPKNFRFLKRDDSVELTRLTTLPVTGKENLASKRILAVLLYKAIYQWSLLNKVRYLYFAVEEHYLKLLTRMGFPCELIGQPKELSPGVRSMAVMLDWDKFYDKNFKWRPDFLSWIATVQLVPGLELPPQHTSGMKHLTSPLSFSDEILQLAH